MMSGSGSALFGLFPERDKLHRAIQSLRKERIFPITLVSRAKYRSEWWKRLRITHEREPMAAPKPIRAMNPDRVKIFSGNANPASG